MATGPDVSFAAAKPWRSTPREWNCPAYTRPVRLVPRSISPSTLFSATLPCGLDRFGRHWACAERISGTFRDMDLFSLFRRITNTISKIIASTKSIVHFKHSVSLNQSRNQSRIQLVSESAYLTRHHNLRFWLLRVSSVILALKMLQPSICAHSLTSPLTTSKVRS